MSRYLCVCGRIAREGRTTCEACRQADQGKRKARTIELRTPEYRKLRREMLAGDPACHYCQRRRRDLEVGERMTIDHVRARVNGGKSTRQNSAVACSTCNERKGSR